MGRRWPSIFPWRTDRCRRLSGHHCWEGRTTLLRLYLGILAKTWFRCQSRVRRRDNELCLIRVKRYRRPICAACCTQSWCFIPEERLRLLKTGEVFCIEKLAETSARQPPKFYLLLVRSTCLHCSDFLGGNRRHTRFPRKFVTERFCSSHKVSVLTLRRSQLRYLARSSQTSSLGHASLTWTEPYLKASRHELACGN